MLVAFLVLYFVVNELVISTATFQQLGLNPYPFATPIFWKIIHAVMLITCVWYCGWIVGIFLFILHVLSVPHSTLGWIASIPVLFFTQDHTLTWWTVEVILLPYVAVGFIGFAIASYFATPYESLLIYAKETPLFLLLTGLTLVAGFVVRRVVLSQTSDNNDF